MRSEYDVEVVGAVIVKRGRQRPRKEKPVRENRAKGRPRQEKPLRKKRPRERPRQIKGPREKKPLGRPRTSLVSVRIPRTTLSMILGQIRKRSNLSRMTN